jgi:hypothetical protein
MLNIINSIDNHVIQNIKPNTYTQGNPYIKVKYAYKNDFVKITNCDIQKQKSLLEILLDYFEGHTCYDYTKSKDYIMNNINDKSLKDLTKCYKVLKNDIYNFIQDIEYNLPLNDKVLLYILGELKMNVIINKGNNFYKSYCIEYELKTIYIESKNRTKLYDDITKARTYLSETQMIELRDISKLKVKEELSEYAKVLGVENYKKMKKQDLIDKITEITTIK